MKHGWMSTGVTMLALGAGAASALGQTHLMRFADVHKDRIVFTYEDDLWLVSTEGGDATRITNDPGSETWAKFSPDGKLLAFTGQYDGGNDVYVMDAGGGVPRRLTFHPAEDRVLGWFPDGKQVLFRSNREYPQRTDELWKVSVDGGLAQKIPVDRCGLAEVSPDGKSIAYNRIATEHRTWKRYQGGMAPDIWVGDLEKLDFKQLTDWVGADSFPMWRNHSLYFSSDRDFGTLNIFRLDLDTMQAARLTDYSDYDVKYPSIGGDLIVYQYGEALHLLDLNTGKSRPVPIRIPSDRVRVRPELVAVHPTTGSFALSPTGKRVLLEARGEILNLPVEDGEPINLSHTTDAREKSAAWSPDGRWVAYIADDTGEEEIYLADPKAGQPARRLTTGGKGFRMQPVWSPDSKYLVFSDKFMRLNLVNAEDGQSRVIDQGEYDDGWERWGIQDYVWSPDSRWIAYTKMEQTLNESIFLHSLEEGKSYRLTEDSTEDFSPSFDPQGRYLYFLSQRTFNPVMGFVDQNYVSLDMCRPYAVILKAGEPSPFAPKDTEEEVKPAGGTEEKKDEAKSDEPKDKPTVVDLEGIGRRIVAAEGVPAGNYFRLTATEKGFVYLKRNENEFEKYQNVSDQTGGELDLYSYDLKEKKTQKVLPGIANYHLSADGKKLVYRAGCKYGVVEVGKEAKVGDGAVKLDGVRVLVDRGQEFMQMFNEAWRIQRDWFYDANLHGVDWPAIGEKYRKLVPDCGNRSDLTYLIGELIGELNSGHTYVSGGDVEADAKVISTGLLGAEFEVVTGAPHYRIAHIIPGTPGDENERSPLDEPGCPIKEGQFLIAIDGQPVTTATDVCAFLQDKASKVVTLTYNDRPTTDGAKTWRARTIGSENAIRYREWVNRNRRQVEEASGGAIGYLHIPDMGRPGLIEFERSWFPQYMKKAIVIDERYNGGGFTADMIIDRLERKQWAMTQPREGKPVRDPERIFNGHLLVLINEETGSSGEMFAEAIKLRKLAPLMGVRTWGGCNGIEPHEDLTDGGRVTPPQFGLYGLDGKWPIEGHGVDPDIVVPNLPGDAARGKDSQLDKAIEYLQKKIADDPREMPNPPPYPDKSKKAK